MVFYKNVLMSVVITALVLLAIIGAVMYYLRNKQEYPAIIDGCPDYYNLDPSTNTCLRSSAWDAPPASAGTTNCMTIDFKEQSYLLPGSSEGSGICNKKNIAQNCGVTWDGITNNFSIC
jgi:hypothetical protein